MAVTGAPPLSGLKRPALGPPTSVPKNLPAFRGRDVTPPGSAVKVPKLNPSNLPNRGTNVTIPFGRVTPLNAEYDSLGRLDPGDVAFVDIHPPGYLDYNPGQAGKSRDGRTPSGGVGNSMNYVLGIDQVNKLLHGRYSGGWKVGENVLEWPKDQPLVSPFLADRPPKDIATPPSFPAHFGVYGTASNNLTSGKKPPQVRMLERFKLDGIVLSHDEQEARSVGTNREQVLFNIAIQGRAEVNNGYCTYDQTFGSVEGLTSITPAGKKEKKVKSIAKSLNITTDGKNINALINEITKSDQWANIPNASRGVEMYPRGSIESNLHTGAMGPTIGATDPNGKKPYTTYTPVFSNSYSRYPLQMFDRTPQMMDGLYVGLRAYRIDASRVDGKSNPDNNAYFFFQYVPFSGRKADQIHMNFVLDEAINAIDLSTEIDPVKKEMEAELRVQSVAQQQKVKRSGRVTQRDRPRPEFDHDPYDAIRSADLRSMVGVWALGRVMDVKSKKMTAYDSGPSDTGYSLSVDVNIRWMPGYPTLNERRPNPGLGIYFDKDESKPMLHTHHIELGKKMNDRRKKVYDYSQELRKGSEHIDNMGVFEKTNVQRFVRLRSMYTIQHKWNGLAGKNLIGPHGGGYVYVYKYSDVQFKSTGITSNDDADSGGLILTLDSEGPIEDPTAPIIPTPAPPTQSSTPVATSADLPSAPTPTPTSTSVNEDIHSMNVTPPSASAPTPTPTSTSVNEDIHSMNVTPPSASAPSEDPFVIISTESVHEAVPPPTSARSLMKAASASTKNTTPAGGTSTSASTTNQAAVQRARNAPKLAAPPATRAPVGGAAAARQAVAPKPPREMSTTDSVFSSLYSRGGLLSGVGGRTSSTEDGTSAAFGTDYSAARGSLSPTPSAGSGSEGGAPVQPGPHSFRRKN